MRGVVDRNAEARLPYKVEPGRDYLAEVSESVPPWRPMAYQTHSVLSPGAAFSDEMKGQPKEALSPSGVPIVVPQKKYVRALDPAGNVMSLIVSSCRPSPEKPDGDDGLGTTDRILSEKKKSGWLILEPDQEYGGRVGPDYLAWAMAVREFRVKKNLALEEQDRAEHESKTLAAIREQTRANSEMVRDIITGMSEANREMVKDVLKATGDKPSRRNTPAE